MATRTTVQITMPQMGDSVAEGTVLEWRKREGDAVAADETVVEVSTDKVDAEVPAPASGVLTRIVAEPDETVPVGGVLGEMEVRDGGAAPSRPAPLGGEPLAAPTPGTASGELRADVADRGPAALVDLVLPEMGESVTEATVLEWRKREGDAVAADETVVEVSTDKVDAEVPAPVSGTIAEVLVQADETVPAGTVLARIAVSDRAVPEAASGSRQHEELPRSAPTADDANGAAGATPVAARIASAHGIELDQVRGSGPHGRITKEDVLAAIEGDGAASAAGTAIKSAEETTAAGASAELTPTPSRAEPADIELKPIRGPGATLVSYMEESRSIPTATSFRTIPVDALASRRQALRAAGHRLSFTHLIAWAIVEAARDRPVMAHGFAEVDGVPHRVEPTGVSLGVAVDVERRDGSRTLLVPVIGRADALSFRQFIARYDEVVAGARNNVLSAEAYRGANLTLTNPGGIGTVASVPRLMPGQGTIVATGAIGYPAGIAQADPTTLEQLCVAKVMTMSSTYDHRVIQGAESGAFLRRIDQLLQGDDGFYDAIFSALGVEDATVELPPLERARPTRPTVDRPPTPEASTRESSAQGAPGGRAPTAEDAATEAARAAYTTASDATLAGLKAPLAPVPDQPSAPATAAEPVPAEVRPDVPAPADEQLLQAVQAAASIVKAHRMHGHLAARLDPLGTEPVGDPALNPETVDLTPEVMRVIPASVLRVAVPGETFAEALPRLQETYCGTIAYEIEHIADHQQRVWLRQTIESGVLRKPPSTEERRALLERISQVEALESYLHKAFLGRKQFSIEGVDMLVPMLDETTELAAEAGAREVMIGMAHRGRLNVIAHTVGMGYEGILAEFEGEQNLGALTLLPEGGTGDVKYHHGAAGSYQTRAGQKVAVTLAANPSHLEHVDPVVEGRARADQSTRRGRELTRDTSLVIPVLIHGDAAFPAQGVVAETLNLQALEGYNTGGTIHIITDNQLGFTTDPGEGRSTHHASDLAKGFDIPVVHVNADDVEACIAAVRLAMAFRERFGRDALIDLIGYRRFGHNETDEPAYTQPLMYQTVKRHPPVRKRYADELARQGVVTAEEAEAMAARALQRLADAHKRLRASLERGPEGTTREEELDRSASREPRTSVAEDVLRSLGEDLLRLPRDFALHDKLRPQLERRHQALEEGGPIDWAHAESLALASLLCQQVPVRLTGQDTVRGTFSQRHLVLHDASSGATYAPIQHIPDVKAPLELYNSPLSENACVAFEYGYSIHAPEALVLWEAQFGDFVNGAQVIVDQFIASGIAKWGQSTRLTLLLPHGYEGSGPEHSSGRLERFLQLASEGNIRVANCTTSAQYFHLLRRQALIEKRRPLVIMTPKSLLRLPAATSPLADLASGGFRRVLDDPTLPGDREQVTRLVLCSGKLYYDLVAADARAGAAHVAVGRVEMLYPFVASELRALIESYPALEQVVWAQEEPRNMGAHWFMSGKLPHLLPNGVEYHYVGRQFRASTGEGYPAAHRAEQDRIVAEALGFTRAEAAVPTIADAPSG